MANSLILRGRTDLVPPSREGRAAQYVRMSTDHQRYSTQNQAATIAVYAAQRNLTIVSTYADEGKSGVVITRREGLIELINDVRFGRADFDHILVYDVSRWGRFQDVDESAYYEFICKQAGIKVCYCAEEFDNDGSVISNIVKNLKRVMAAEFSRELSVKVHAGQCRVASLGFKQGGFIGYGLRRVLVDEERRSKGILEKGQRKHLQTDRVLVRPGPHAEQDIVAQIFRQFVVHRRSQKAIARLLNQEQVPNHRGTPWSDTMIGNILRNEIYIGNSVYNRASCRLKQPKKNNPPEQWIRATGLFDPIVDTSIFAKAQQLLKEQYVRLSDEELLSKLRSALKEHGRLSMAILQACEAPSAALYAYRFGSLREAFRRVGYVDDERDYDYLDARQQADAELQRQASVIASHVRALGAAAVFDQRTKVLTVDDRLPVSMRMARYYFPDDHHHAPTWMVNRRAVEPANLILALRLDEENRAVMDYFLLPLREMAETRIALTKTDRSRFARYRCHTIDDVVQLMLEQVAAIPPP